MTLPGDIADRVTAGEISPYQAAVEAVERAAAQEPQPTFNDHLRWLAQKNKSNMSVRRGVLHQRLYPEQKRDDAGRFAPQEPGTSGGSAAGFDGGFRGSVPPGQSERQKISDAIDTLAQADREELHRYGEWHRGE